MKITLKAQNLTEVWTHLMKRRYSNKIVYLCLKHHLYVWLRFFSRTETSVEVSGKTSQKIVSYFEA